MHRAYDTIGSYRRDKTIAELVGDFTRMRLVHQPGEAWQYGHSVDVLGRVVEVASGQPLDKFFESRIFKPLGMVDTGFVVPPDKLARVVDPLASGRPALWDITKPTTLFMGGGGLASTAPDYLRFCQMLLNGGELDGARILSPATVQQMTTNLLPPEVPFTGMIGQFVGPKVGTGWGLGFAVRTNPEASNLPGAVGSFNWSGVWGTWFWIDPVEKLIGVLMIQVPPDMAGPPRAALRHLAYAALSVPQPAPASAPVTVSPDILKSYAGTYDFGPSLSARDKEPPLKFIGTGITFAIVEGKVVVRETIDGGPGERAGVKALDVITDIDDVPTRGLGLNEVIDKLRGKPGTPVRAENFPLPRGQADRGHDRARADPGSRRAHRGPGRGWQAHGRGQGSMGGARFRQGQAGACRRDVRHGVSLRGRRSHALGVRAQRSAAKSPASCSIPGRGRSRRRRSIENRLWPYRTASP